MGAVLLAAVSAAVAVTLLLPPRPRVSTSAPSVVEAPVGDEPGLLRRWRAAWATSAAVAALTFVGGVAGWVVAPVVGFVVWTIATRAEPPSVRRRRELLRRELPHVVALLAAALRSGSDPADALTVVCRALPGPATDRLGPLAARLALGGEPVTTWTHLAADPDLGALGRAMARAQRTGAPVVAVMDRLADDLARAARTEVEDRARTVGVKAAVPLGLCLLPAFVLLGIVPLVAGLFASLQW